MGPRILSSCLNEAGFKTRKVFLSVDKELGDIPPGLSLYPDHLLKQIAEICEDSLFVGISVMTNYFDRVAQLSAFLRDQVGVTVVLGGIHATLMPSECAEVADFVCVGECEGTIVDLARALAGGDDPSKLPNVCCKKAGQFVQNPLRALIENLDEIPFPDYSLDDDYTVLEGNLVQVDLDVLETMMSSAPGREISQRRPYYLTMMTRGCRYNCTYCCNRSVRQIYNGQRFLRRRSVENFIAELVWVKKELPFVQMFVLADDSFFDTEEAQIESFCRCYKKDVALPFLSLGTPFGITPVKLELMVDAGMVSVQVGIQTGSERIRKLYKRPFTEKEVLRLTDSLAQCAGRIQVRYDIILDNPLETDEDVIDTIRLFLRIKKPYHIQFFSLTLFPGTALADLALTKGIITDWTAQVYRKQQFHKRRTYLNFVISLFNLPVPKFFIRFLISRPALYIFNRPYFGRLLRLIFKE